MLLLEKSKKNAIWIRTVVRGRFSNCWIHRGHCRSSYNLIPLTGWNRPWRWWAMQIFDSWACLVLLDPGSASAALHTLKERCDGSDWHVDPRASHSSCATGLGHVSCSLHWASANAFSHVWEFSASDWDTLGFFASVSACLSSQALNKGTNYCGAAHHCM